MRSERLLRLLLILQARGCVVAPDMARELEVSVRTVYRDVSALSAAGVPVWTEQGRGGGIRLLPGYRTDMTGLTAAESRALVAMSGRAVPDDLGMGSALASAVHKLVAAVPASHRPAAEAARARVLVDHAGWYRRPPSAPALDVVQQAVWEQRRVRLRYRSGSGAGPARSVLVDPYGLVAKTGLWYLVGRHRGQERMWRVDRVAHATVLDQPSRAPADVDLAAVWERLRRQLEEPAGIVPVAVTVRVRDEVLDMVLRVTAARRFLPGEDSEPERVPSPDALGWVTLTMRFRAERAAVAARMPFGGDIEIVAPESARKLLRDTAATAVARHTDGKLSQPQDGAAAPR